MQGTIVNYRRGRKTQNTYQIIVQVEGVDSKDKAAKLIGKKVSWNAPGKSQKVLSGKVTATHGNNGSLKATFETGVPGQALGQKVKFE
ncbi:MAG: 50S ribosomal protein L35ae [archaeon]